MVKKSSRSMAGLYVDTRAPAGASRCEAYWLSGSNQDRDCDHERALEEVHVRRR